MTHAVAIVPAFNRADTVGATVTALRSVPDVLDVVVVDDGSSDRTAAAAAAAGARVVELARNRGKGAAVAAGIAASGAPDVYLLIDADLAETASLAGELLAPVAGGEADMCIAVMAEPDVLAPSADLSLKGGFGLVKRFAARVLRAETGHVFAEPLSGQRAVRGPLLRSLQLARGFGLEIGLTLDAAERGAAINEISVAFTHRQTGRDLSGLAHRARIGRHVYLAVSARTGRPQAICCLAVTLAGSVRLPAQLLSQQSRRPRRETSQRSRPSRALRPPGSVRSLRQIRERLGLGSAWRRDSRPGSPSMLRLASRLRRRRPR